ncbi:caltractin-like [Scaptodrosophila lebanonensis]|uniref:Caltractin-like n=1 Tax=Drosophila lebanonensis TaxID=7225 RepID=A0A6J2UHU5_DROLE|nr:caltractin-like [Scaptodrosophila lebanonensis]
MDSSANEYLPLFQDVFEILNKEGDGSITTKELGTVIRALGRQPSDAELQDMINEVDADGNGSIEFPEFCKLLETKLTDLDKEDELREAFRIYDKDNNGYIGLSEIRTVMTALGEKMSDEEIDDLIREADLDQDGRISFDEFVNMMTSGESKLKHKGTPLLFSPQTQKKLKHKMEWTEDQVQEFRDAFSVFDRGGTGTITSTELGSVMRNLGQNPTEAELYDLIDEIDVDGNGEIDFMEFIQAMANRMQALNSEEELKEAFKVFDRDDDGYISQTELRSVMMNLGERFSDEEFDEMMKEIDLDNDGKISFTEFVNAMKY